MSKSAIYTVNSATITTTANSIIPVGNIVRRYGQNVDINGNGIITKGCGYYDTNVSVTFEGTATGTATIALYKDGVPVPGAYASRSTADATIYSVSFGAYIKNMNCEASILTLVSTGAVIDVTNVAVTVSKE